MGYIGVQPTDTYLSIASQQITGNGGATYTLDYSVSDEESLAVFVNNVRQNVSSYTVSSNQLTLGGTISASDSCWVLFLGRTVGTKTPAVGSVTNDMLAGSISNSKLANSSITLNGSAVSLGGSATVGGTNTPNFSATASTSHGVSSAVWTKVQINTEHFDTANAFDTSNYRFTVPSGQAGKYQFNGHLMANATGTAQLNEFGIAFYVNGSASRIHFWYMENNPIYYSSLSLSSIIDLSVGDYVELYCYVVDLSGGPILDANTSNNSGFSGYKIIE